MKNNRYSNTRSFTQLALAGLLAISAGVAQAQTFTLQNNQLQITGGSGTTFSSQTQTISSAGVVGTFIDVPSTNGVGIPSFNFTLVPNAVANGSYSFRVGVTIDDDANNRRMEAKIDTLTLTVSGSTVTGTIPAGGNSLRVLGRDGGNTLQVALTVPNDQASGPITVSGGTVSFNATTLINRIRAETNTAFDTYILKEFDQPATYTYRITVQQTSGPATLDFGTTQPGFTSLPKVSAGDVVPNTAFILNTNELAAGFTSAPTVTGKFNVVFVSSGGGGSTTTTTNVTTGTTNLTNEVSNIVIPTTGPVSAAVVTAVNTAVENTNTLLTSASAQITAGTLTPTQALTTLAAANTALDKAGTAKSTTGGSGVSSEASTSAITNIANVVGALSKSTTPLTTAQKNEVATIVTSTVTSATKLITSDTPRSAILSLVEATSKLLQSSTDATGEIKAALVTQLQALSTTATQTILPTLPESIRGTTDLNSIDAIRALATAKATVTEVVQKASPVACQFNPPSGAEHSAASTIELDNAWHQKYNDAAKAYMECVRTRNSGTASALVLEQGGNVFAATAEQPVFNTGTNGSLIIEYAGAKYSGVSNTLRVVPTLLSDGLHSLPDGRLLYINAGTAIEVSASPLNGQALERAVTAAGFTSTAGSDGSLRIDLGNNERFAGAFALDNLGNANTACSSVTFSSPTGKPTDSSYVFEMVCNDGAKQRITPFPHSSVFFDTVANAGFDVRTDRSTGVISIEGVGNVRPSFFVTPLTLADTTYLNANKTAEGIAVRTKDANGDGKTDYEVISADGVQLMYGL